MWSIVLSDITAGFGCTLALLYRSSLCGRVCALSVFHGRMCAVCLFVGQDGCVGHPVTLIPSQTWCVECKYELFLKLTLIFPLSLCACVFMYKCQQTGPADY